MTATGVTQAPEVFSVQAQKEYVNVATYGPVLQGLQFGAILGYSDAAIFRRDPTDGLDSLHGCDDSATNDTWRCRGYGAAVCVLQPCVRTYSCSIEAGRINETVVEETNVDQIWGFGDPGITTSDDIPVAKVLFGLLDLQCITDGDRKNLIENGYDLDNVGRWLSYNTSFFPPPSPTNSTAPFPESLLANDCLYILEPFFISSLWLDILSPLLVGNVTRSLARAPASAFGYAFEGTEQLVHLYNSGNISMASISDKFANLAQALTLWVRANGEAGYSRRAEGDVLHYAVCVRVTWAWIALPAALAGFGLVLFALTVATTARRAVPMWKLFPLAVLLCGPAGEGWVDWDLLAADTSKAGKTSVRDDGCVEGMSRLASRISVQLHVQDGKYQLRQLGRRLQKVQR